MMDKGTEIKILDHGYIKLVDWMGSDEDIVEAARMSTGKGFLGWGTKNCDTCLIFFDVALEACPRCRGTIFTHLNQGDEKLLRFLYENRHDTPFEMVELVVEVQAPIMVFREWHRHRTQSYNEMSARYVQMPNLHYIPSAERIIAASKKHRNKQQGGAGELKMPPGCYTEAEAAGWVRERLNREQQAIYETYEVLLDMGIAPEVARVDTPVAHYSRMRAKTDLRNWLAFLTLRSDAAAQWEIRRYVYALGYFVSRLFPRTWDIWLNADRRRPEIDRSGFIVLPEAA